MLSTPQWADLRARTLLQEFQLKDLVGNDWTFGWNRSRSRYGVCNYSRTEISLSYHYVQVATQEQVTQTILHEISHIVAGPGTGHGIAWKKACLIVGAKPIRCGAYIENLPSLYRGTCPVCQGVFKANRRLKNMSQRLCCKRGCTARVTKKFIQWQYS